MRQFPNATQKPILREMRHVLKQTYISRETVDAFLRAVATTEKLVGEDAPAFWRTVNFLDCQQNGTSQHDMLELLGETLGATHGVDIAECGTVLGPFVYLDDAIFTGDRVSDDLEQWIRDDSPRNATVHVIVMATHSLSEYLVRKRLQTAATAASSEIDLKFWRLQEIENRKARKNDSEVLWPIELPDEQEVAAYAALEQRFPWVPRVPSGQLGPFSSENGRQLLEREFLVAGARIRADYENPSTALRPLGFSPFGLGFRLDDRDFSQLPQQCTARALVGQSGRVRPLSLRQLVSTVPEEDLPGS